VVLQWIDAERGDTESRRGGGHRRISHCERGSFLYWAPVILSGSVDPLPASLFHR